MRQKYLLLTFILLFLVLPFAVSAEWYSPILNILGIGDSNRIVYSPPQIINQYYVSPEYTVEVTGNETLWVDSVSISNNIATITPKAEANRTYNQCILYDKPDEKTGEAKCLKFGDVVYPIPTSLPVKDVAGTAKGSIVPTTDVKGTYFTYQITDAYTKLGTASITIIANSGLTGTYINTKPEVNYTHLSVSDANLVLYYPFDVNNDSTKSMYDYSSNSKSGVLQGTAIWTSNGYIGGGLSLSGVVGSSMQTILPPMGYNSTWTVFLRVNKYNQTSFAKYALISNLNGAATGHNYLAIQNNTNKLYSVFYMYNGTAYSIYTGGIINSNVWNSISATYNGSTIAFYINGIYDGYMNATYGIQNGTSALFVGVSGGASDNLNGTIDSIIMFNRSMTQSEIQTMGNLQYNIFQPSGTAQYNFNKLNEEMYVNVSSTYNIFNSTNIQARTECSGTNSAWQTLTGNDIFQIPSGTGTSCTIDFNLSSNAYNSYTPNLLSPITLTTWRNNTITPLVSFVSPTLANNTVSLNQSFIVNATINSILVNNFTYGFNNVNYTAKDNTLVLALNLDNNSAIGENNTVIKDFSNYNNVGVGTNITFVTGKYNSGAGFNFGNGSSIIFPDSTSLNVSTNNITFGAWVYPYSLTGDYQVIMSKVDFSYRLWTNGNKWECNIFNGSSQALTQTSTIKLNQWTKIDCVYNGTTLMLYENGILNVSKIVSGTFLPVGGSLRIGSRVTDRYFNGTIDELRIWNRALTSDEILFRYYSNIKAVDYNNWNWYINQTLNTSSATRGTNLSYQTCATGDIQNCTDLNWYDVPLITPNINFTSPTPQNGTLASIPAMTINVSINSQLWVSYGLTNINFTLNNVNYSLYNPNLVLAYNLDNNSAIGESDTMVADSGPYLNNGTVTNALWTTNGKYGGAYTFNGINASINPSITSSYVKPLATSPYTLLAWINSTSISKTQDVIVLLNGSNGAGAIRITSSKLLMYDDGISQAGATTLFSNTWYYVGLTYNGSCFQLFLNGVNDSSCIAVTTPNSGSASANTLFIGKSTSNYFNGTIDEVRILNKSLSAAEIAERYVTNVKKTNATDFNLQITPNFNQGVNTYQACAGYDGTNCTEVRTYSLDTYVPTFSGDTITITNGSQYNPGLSYIFTTIITNANGTAGIEFNGVNYTMTNLSSVYSKTFATLSPGVYPYYFWAYGSGVLNFYNTTTIKYYTVIKNQTALGLTATTPITYGTITDFAGSNCPSQLTCSLDISNAIYPAGTITANYSTAGNENYTANSTTFSVTINKIVPNIVSTVTSPINYGTISDFTCSGTNSGAADLTYNLNQSNGVYSVGNHYLNCSTTGGENYTGNSKISTLVVTKIPSQMSLTFDKTSPQMYPTPITPTCSIIAGGSGIVGLTNGTSGVPEILGVGVWTFNCSYTGLENYSSSSNTTTFTITQNDSYVLPLIATPSWNVIIGTSTTVTGTCFNQLNCNLTINGAEVPNPNTQTLLSGGYNYTFSTLGNKNYSASSFSNILFVNASGCMPDCLASGSHCSGTTYSDGCGGLCAGTMSCGGGGGGDSVYPSFSVYSDNNGTITDTGLGLFGVKVVNTTGQVYLHINGVNVLATSTGSGYYNATYNMPHQGIYPYYWYSYGNGSLHNYNNSATYYYTVLQSKVINPTSCGTNLQSLESSNIYGKLCSIVSSSDILTYKQSTNFTINIPISNADLSACTYCTCTVSLFYPNGTTFVSNGFGVNNNGNCQYTTSTDVLGNYKGEMDFTDGTNYGKSLFYMIINGSGQQVTSNQTTFIIIGIVVMIIVIIFLFVLSLLFKHPGAKIFLMALSGLTLIVLIGIIAANAQVYLAEFPNIASIYSTYYIVIISLAAAAGAGLMLWLIYYVFQLWNKARGKSDDGDD